MKKEGFAFLSELTPSEILEGVLLNLPDDFKFPEQYVYEFFLELERSNPKLQGRFKIIRRDGRLVSHLLQRLLNFMEMGKILDLPMPNPVDQYYKFRTSHRSSIEKDLRERGVLPRFDAQLKILANRFSESMQAV